MYTTETLSEVYRGMGDVRPLLTIVRSRVTVDALVAAIGPVLQRESNEDVSKADEYARLAFAVADSGPAEMTEEHTHRFIDIMEAAGFELKNIDADTSPHQWYAWMYLMLVGYAITPMCPLPRGAALLEAYADGWLARDRIDFLPIFQFARWIESHATMIDYIVVWRAFCGIWLISTGLRQIHDPITMNELHEEVSDVVNAKTSYAAARVLALRRVSSVGLNVIQTLHDDLLR